MPLKLRRHSRSKRWYIRGTIRGQFVDESTGTDSIEAAEQIRILREADLLKRSIHGDAATATFLEAAVGYLEHGGEARFLGRFDEKSSSWTGLIGHFGSMPLAHIDQRAIDFAARKLYPRAMPSTLNRQIYTPISAVLAWAASRGLTPIRRISRPRQPRGRVVWLKPEEAEKLISNCAPHLRPLIVFLLGTGARMGEALNLQWEQVDLASRHVIFLNTKNGETRGAPLNRRVIVELGNLKGREGAVFRKPNGQPYAPKDHAGGQIKSAFASACRRAGLRGVTPHTLRHSWASWLFSQTRDIRVLMELGGWKSERMVLRYAHTNSEHLQSAIDTLPWDEDSGNPSMKRPK